MELAQQKEGLSRINIQTSRQRKSLKKNLYRFVLPTKLYNNPKEYYDIVYLFFLLQLLLQTYKAYTYAFTTMS